jgi:hypothetical protein
MDHVLYSAASARDCFLEPLPRRAVDPRARRFGEDIIGEASRRLHEIERAVPAESSVRGGKMSREASEASSTPMTEAYLTSSVP